MANRNYEKNLTDCITIMMVREALTGVSLYPCLRLSSPCISVTEFWGAVMSGKVTNDRAFIIASQIWCLPDYQAFAAENADRLARAIEKGIPSSLRGMMWQLMYFKETDSSASIFVDLLLGQRPKTQSWKIHT